MLVPGQGPHGRCSCQSEQSGTQHGTPGQSLGSSRRREAANTAPSATPRAAACGQASPQARYARNPGAPRRPPRRSRWCSPGRQASLAGPAVRHPCLKAAATEAALCPAAWVAFQRPESKATTGVGRWGSRNCLESPRPVGSALRGGRGRKSRGVRTASAAGKRCGSRWASLLRGGSSLAHAGCPWTCTRQPRRWSPSAQHTKHIALPSRGSLRGAGGHGLRRPPPLPPEFPAPLEPK
mmetsp:Transcript_52838/g.113187  ORF Transcript_52838/g.113187 Transcript_52838/m.113187 type:complete len:238 (+) Transcript_52838:75-788(+)